MLLQRMQIRRNRLSTINRDDQTITFSIDEVLRLVTPYNDAWARLLDQIERDYTGDRTQKDNPFDTILERIRVGLEAAANRHRFFVPTTQQYKWLQDTVKRSNIKLPIELSDMHEMRKQVLGSALDQFTKVFKFHLFG